jgi:hypothetical protein
MEGKDKYTDYVFVNKEERCGEDCKEIRSVFKKNSLIFLKSRFCILFYQIRFMHSVNPRSGCGTNQCKSQKAHITTIIEATHYKKYNELVSDKVVIRNLHNINSL